MQLCFLQQYQRCRETKVVTNPIFLQVPEDPFLNLGENCQDYEFMVDPRRHGIEGLRNANVELRVIKLGFPLFIQAKEMAKMTSGHKEKQPRAEQSRKLKCIGTIGKC